METHVITNDKHDDIAQQLDAEATLDDILLLYDNMEFYASKNRNKHAARFTLNEGVRGQGHFAINNFEGYKNEIKREIKGDYDVPSNSPVANDPILPDERDNVNICQSSLVNIPSATNHLKDVRMLSDAFTSEQHQSICTNDRNSLYESGTRTSRSLDENCIKNVSHGSMQDVEADGQNHMDNLMNCNSHIDTCCKVKKQMPEKIQEVSHHLKHDENQVVYRSANEKSLHISKTENLSIKSQVMQMEGKLSWEWKCDKEDSSKLDNVISDRDIRRVEVSKCDDRLNTSTCESDLSGFIEEINESIDELISEGENGISDDCLSVKFSDLSSSESNSFTSSSETNSSVNLRTFSMENGKMDGCITSDESSTTSGDSVKVTKDDIVETDSGYYWLTCNIDENDKTKEGIINCDVEISKSSYAEENLQGVEDLTNNSKSQRVNKEIVMEKPHFVEEFENLLQNMQNSGRKNTKRNSDKSNSSVSDENVEFSSGKYERIVDDVLETCSGDSVDTSSSESSGINEGIPNIMTMSAPNFLSLETSSLNRNRISRDDNHIQTVSNDNIQHQSLKRKHSAPPSFGKVYKVVSVDIPKLNLSKMANKSMRYGDASKACVNRESTFNALKKMDFDDEHRLSKNGKADNNSSVKSCTTGKHKQYLQKSSVEMEHKGSIWDHVYSSTDNVSVLDTSFEPPVMFQDDPDVENGLGNHGNQVDRCTDIHTGPILKPPPAFATVSIMGEKYYSFEMYSQSINVCCLKE